jgi:hypothetical protein
LRKLFNKEIKKIRAKKKMTQSTIFLLLLISLIMVNSLTLNKIAEEKNDDETSFHLGPKICTKICKNLDLIDDKFVDMISNECECQQEQVTEKEHEEQVKSKLINQIFSFYNSILFS